MNLGNAGDAAVVPVINASRWIVTNVYATNSSSGAASNAYLGIFTAAGGSTGSPQGATIVAAAVLTSVTNTTFVKSLTVAPLGVTSAQTAQNIYFNVGSTTAGVTNATIDVFVIGQDLS